MSESQPNRDPLSELRSEQGEPWRQGDRIPVESIITRSAMLPDDNLLVAFVVAEFRLRADLGDAPTVDEYITRFPQLGDQLRSLLERDRPTGLQTPAERPASDPTPQQGDASVESTAKSPPPSGTRLPERIGRYRIERVLGQGGFGIVYLARDEQLNRPVAVKVPHADRVPFVREAELYLTEARTVAGLEHPHIVPVYDVGSSSEFPFFVVSKYIDGTDLARRLKRSRLSHREAVELAAIVADVLEYAHRRGVVHRDIKPSNILLDAAGTAYVADFGLALREENLGHGPHYAGTPAYMSPEQASGEGHRVDGRSDIFSLGIVLFELLAGRPPFRGASAIETLAQIAAKEPPAPRQIDDTVPPELERICLKALSKCAADRYATAGDFANDLRHSLSEPRPGTTPLSAPSKDGVANRTGAAAPPHRRSVRVGVAAAITVFAAFIVWQIHGRFQAAALVKRLVAADVAEVPGIVREMHAYRRWADPMLREQEAQAPQDADRKLHRDLAFLPVEESRIADLQDDLLRLSPRPFVVVRDALSPYQERVAKRLWDVALQSDHDAQERFRAACALATYAPNDLRWAQVNKPVANHLVSLEASTLAAWREVLRPAKVRLIKPLAALFRDTSHTEQARLCAAQTLADYAAEDPHELFDLLADAELYQFPMLFDALAVYKQQVIAFAHEELAARLPKKATDEQKEHWATRQANVAIALMRLGSPEDVWPVLKLTPDPRVRSDIIHWLSPLGGDPRLIDERLDHEDDITVRRALVLLLGEFTPSQLPAARRPALSEKLLVIFENDPDAGLHGAAEWVLRRWGQSKRVDDAVEKLKIDERARQTGESSHARRWYINTHRQTLVVIDGGEFLMGSVPSDPAPSAVSPLHACRIRRRFAIAARELTRSHFRAFERSLKGAKATAQSDSDESPDGDRPQTPVTWYEAAHYCDWLSGQENIPRDQWCFDPDAGKYGPGMKPKEKFWELTRYRLPTEAEWEFACRAGTVTTRYYGTSDRLLPHYAWYLANGEDHTWPTGLLEPNDLGLFDMLGNATEWCMDRMRRPSLKKEPVLDDTPETSPVAAANRIVQRGGDFVTRPSLIHSYNRFNSVPDYYGSDIGFRTARTVR
jgi:formylglycine-generating enzyme required for sulfatase activity